MPERRGTVAVERREAWRYAVATKRFVFILFLLAGIWMTLLWYKAEYDSCKRASGNRAPIRNAIMSFPEAADKLGPAPKKLDCGPPFPDH